MAPQTEILPETIPPVSQIILNPNRKLGGRPPKWTNPDLLADEIEKYFLACDARTKPFVTNKGVLIQVPEPMPYTVTGLALWLGMSREGILGYETREDRCQFHDTLREAKLRIHNFAEACLWQPKIAQGMIFNLCNNWGWVQKSETTVNAIVAVTGVPPALQAKLDQLYQPAPVVVDVPSEKPSGALIGNQEDT